MAQLEIFIGYMGLIPQYHIINYPEFKIPRDIKAKTHFIESDNKPARFRSKLLKHHNKSNKTSTNYEGTGLNKR
jgi:hypothetical protein